MTLTRPPAPILQALDAADRERLGRYQRFRRRLRDDERWAHLLWTWHVREPVHALPERRDDPLLRHVERLEADLGDGRWRDRESLQKHALARLAAPLRKAVCRIGEEAKDGAWLATAHGRNVDWLRMLATERRRLRRWLDGRARRGSGDAVARAREFARLASFGSAGTPSPAALQTLDADARRLLQALEDLAELASRKPDVLEVVGLPIPAGAYRRERSGRPATQWKAADQRMAQLPVPPDVRIQLLQAWGLRPLD